MAVKSQKVTQDHDGPVTIITINRPERRNAVDEETAALLTDAFQAFEADEARAVAVLTGADGNFCAGYDLKSIVETEAQAPYEPEGRGPMGPSRMMLQKPCIAAVEGYAVAGGLELSLLCDLRVASRSAVFGVFCRRWGVPLVDGGTVRLPRLIGHSRALDMILTGRPVDAEEALQFGLANRLVSTGEALAAAVALAREIAQFPQICARADRLSSYLQWGLGVDDALVVEGRGGVEPIMTEARAGAGRFAGGKGRGGRFDDL